MTSTSSSPEPAAAGADADTPMHTGTGTGLRVDTGTGVETTPGITNGGTGELRRALEPRHLQMIAIGGAIGTGLFLASGETVTTAGPGGALVAYAAMGFMVYLLMQSLGELSAYLPVSGSFSTYATRFVSPSFGFATAWNYWSNWAITVAAELVAASVVMSYWLPDVPSWVWSALFLVVLFLVNALSVRAYGEGEFLFASIKVITVVFFLGVGVLMIAGIIAGPSPGMNNWTLGEAPFVGGALAAINVFMIAGFSFQGTELVAVAAGEAKDPERSLPKAIRTVFFRILFFYIGAIAVIGFLVPYTDPRLLHAAASDDVTVSPFTLIFDRAGILAAATIVNAVILTAILSAGMSGLYASTRMLWSLADEGRAPRFFARLTRRGVPLPALVATTLIGAMCFLTTYIGDGGAYAWLVNASGLGGFLIWMSIAWSHYRFRNAYVAQGFDLEDLPYRAKWFPAGPLVALALCAVVLVGQNIDFWRGDVDGRTMLTSYVGLPLFLGLWWGHKLVTKSRGVRLEEANLARS